jgi:hypothetical protein
MKNFLSSQIAITLLVLVAFPCTSQDVRYSGPPDDTGFFPIGWSLQGTRLAYGWFETTQMISNGSSISVVVQDLITDEILWHGGNTWDEGNVGEGGDNYYPTSATKAWELLGTDVHEQLFRTGIQTEPAEGVSSFPYSNGDQIRVEVKQEEGNTHYQVFAYSDNFGDKMLTEGEKDDPYNNITLEGYVLNPNRSRIAVIFNQRSFSRPYSNYWVIGCHLHAGFKKTAK